MKKLVILLILLAAVVFTAGCTERSQEYSKNAQEGSSVVEVTDLEQINASLQQGPVLMKIGSENCGPCKDMEPILQELATEYGGRAKVVSVDIEKSPQLAAYFGSVYAIPDITVIVNIKDGKYIYMRPDEKVTAERSMSKITGSREKGIYEDVLNFALVQANKDKSQ